MNRSRPAPHDDDAFWSAQMARVAAFQDADSFMHIYDHFAPRLHRYLLGLKLPAAQAEELVQEAMLRAWRHAGAFDPALAGLSTWLFRIARNLHFDASRRQGGWLPSDDDIEQIEITPEHDASPDARADHAILARAIDTLPADAARMIRMSYLESHSHSEIAAELNLPLGTVKSTLRRAFEKLRTALGACR
ncbi:sigma-70 family RNA polymerase sigma factor [Xanthomonadaceae bacterium XH05]|nr:sigma-70 family RNA polymerase sigma factor [Xanthomonadaceae bacterium XH05]